MALWVGRKYVIGFSHSSGVVLSFPKAVHHRSEIDTLSLPQSTSPFLAHLAVSLPVGDFRIVPDSLHVKSARHKPAGRFRQR